MRRAASAASAATVLALLASCAVPPPEADSEREKQRKAGYNRREIMSPRPGVFTGEDGAWTVMRSDRDSPTPEPSTQDSGEPSGQPSGTTADSPACEGDPDCEPVPEEGVDRGD